MFAAISSPILPVVIANNTANQVHSESGAWGAVAGVAVIALIVAGIFIYGKVADFMESRRGR